LSEIFIEDATTTRTLRNIKDALRNSLRRKYNKELNSQEELKGIEENLLSVHGLDKTNFDFVSKIEKIISGKLNDHSIDDNSNKSEKTITGILAEATNPVNKAIGYDYLYRMMVQLYGKRTAKYLSGEMYDFSLAISDSTQLLKNYCYALDASKLVIDGRPFGQLQSKPPKRISSYISALNETVHQMSVHLAGAIAISSFFLDVAHLGIFGEDIKLEDLRENKIIRKYVENCFQTFVHSVNHLARSGNESPFSNISIFDRPKIRNFFKDMWWYFDSSLWGERDYEVDEDYVEEYILELQEIWLDFFDKGDPMANGLPYRFPVCTVNLTKTDDQDVEDKKFLDKFLEKEVYRYNIFASQGSKAASCCFRGDQKLKFYHHGELKVDSFKNLIENYDEKDCYVTNLGSKKSFEKVEVDYTDNFLNITTGFGTYVCTKDHLWPVLVKELKRNGVEETFLFLKEAKDIKVGEFLINHDNQFEDNIILKIEEVENNDKKAYCVNINGDTNKIFELADGTSTHNCRLLSDMEMLDIAGQANSFGGSGALSVGSHRVLTVNFNRIALESEGDKEEYFKILNKRLVNASMILKAHKKLIGMLTDSGLQSFIKLKWIDMDRMFSTVGLLGLTEASEMVSQISGIDKDEFTGEVLSFVNERTQQLAMEAEQYDAKIEINGKKFNAYDTVKIKLLEDDSEKEIKVSKLLEMDPVTYLIDLEG
jgi:anaerobic ribonucleoside-triphosphate reductase